MIGKQIEADILARHGAKAHPRIIFTEADFTARVEEAKTSAIVRGAIDAVIGAAEEYLKAPFVEHEIYDGIRLLQRCRSIQDIVRDCSLAFRFTGEKKYARRAIDELLHASAFPNFNPRHFLDVGEISFAFGIGYDWLYDEMTEDERATLRAAVKEKAFIPATDDFFDRPRERTYRWFQHIPGDNWKLVCGGGLSTAAMAMFDEMDDDLPETVLSYIFDDAYAFIRRAYVEADGSYTESLTYWNYATLFLGYYHSALMSAAGKDYGLTDWIGLKKTANFIAGLCSNRNVNFNFGDAPETHLVEPIFLWVGKNFGAPYFASLRIKKMEKDPSPLDLFWYDKSLTDADAAGFDPDFGAVGAECAAFRTGWNESDLYAAIHFGDNGVPHYHMDTGTFIIEAGGKRFFSDLGPDNYNLTPYSGTYRYRAEGHNTLVVNPSTERDQKPASSCRIQKYKSGEVAFAVADITDAYENLSDVRGMMMDKKNETVILRDEIRVNPEDTVLWFAHTKAKIFLESNTVARLDLDGEKLTVRLLTDGLAFSVMPAVSAPTSPVVEGQAVNKGFQKLAIRMTGKAEYTLSVAFSRQPDYVPEVKPLTEW